ncbi:response regulator transcription factor [Bacillus sp. DX1.1]|uniref:response regulator transcription factor n=1 Tax=unclassified Bacillus (in: firmicutes) TaxID=185979 RepID=UPI002570FD08|nr:MULTISPECIES: response regulator transcription factor [unclassified Bacillus (in: firmicutes)]MDM5154426.1 response regulator transcription factor [Bacillus sp. DX1.1]WJE83330.1 response regulator transcription factor [Bacillus sp. DX3.1]
MVRILVAEDDCNIQKLIKLSLESEGFDIIEARDGEQAVYLLHEVTIDLVILDIMMPKLDGWGVCEEIRRYFDMPILMVTAKGETTDKIKGFQKGTDDYIVKPFDPTEFGLRVHALLKRYRIFKEQIIQIEDVKIDASAHTVEIREKVYSVPLKEFELLYTLMSYPGKLFTRRQLIEKIWDINYEGDERTVDVHINRLRKKFDKLTDSFEILTIRGLGYRLQIKQ